ncbi:MAG: AAA family ATPase [Chthoniobacterales bacterium]|nr:AAA family ATPase [Chthoniobacterales bacterium]
MLDLTFHKRYLHHSIAADLKQKMVLLDGPRQVGKTTLAKSVAQKKEKMVYLNWDNVGHRKQLLAMQWEGSADFLVLDELHKYSKWKSWLKGVWDTRRAGEKIMVTGSARLDIYRRGGDSLMGRYHHYRLHPFSLLELSGASPRKFSEKTTPPLLRNSWELSGMKEMMALGGFPEPLLSSSQRAWRRWGKERFERVFREDIRDTSSVKELGELELLGQLLPSRVASPLSMQSLSEDLSVSPKTIKEWIELLRRNYYVFQVPPWHRKIERALKKGSKYYLWDWSQVPEEGPRFENLMASHLLKYCHYHEDLYGRNVKLYYVRDSSKREVDFLIAWEEKPWLLVECKSKGQADAKGLHAFAQRLGVQQRFVVCLESGIDLEDRKNKTRTMSASRFLSMLV